MKKQTVSTASVTSDRQEKFVHDNDGGHLRMKKQTVSTTTVNPDEKAKFVHYSDGSELIPSEIPSETESDQLLVSGYTIDDEGILNNYAIEPELSEATYPNPKQQFRYILWGIGAVAFVTVILGIAFAVS